MSIIKCTLRPTSLYVLFDFNIKSYSDRLAQFWKFDAVRFGATSREIICLIFKNIRVNIVSFCIGYLLLCLLSSPFQLACAVRTSSAPMSFHRQYLSSAALPTFCFLPRALGKTWFLPAHIPPEVSWKGFQIG